MAGRKQQAPPWRAPLEGALLALGIYLLAAVLESLLLLNGVLPEAWAFYVLAAACCGAALGGGLLCARRCAWGSLPGAMAGTGIFLLVLAAAALLCWEEIAWLGRGGVLLACGALGGLLAGLLGGKSGRKGRRQIRRPARLEKKRL